MILVEGDSGSKIMALVSGPGFSIRAACCCGFRSFLRMRLRRGLAGPARTSIIGSDGVGKLRETLGCVVVVIRRLFKGLRASIFAGEDIDWRLSDVISGKSGPGVVVL